MHVTVSLLSGQCACCSSAAIAGGLRLPHRIILATLNRTNGAALPELRPRALLVSAAQGLYTFVHPSSPCCFESESRRFEVVETDEFSAVQIPPKLAVLIREKWQVEAWHMGWQLGFRV